MWIQIIHDSILSMYKWKYWKCTSIKTFCLVGVLLGPLIEEYGFTAFTYLWFLQDVLLDQVGVYFQLQFVFQFATHFWKLALLKKRQINLNTHTLCHQPYDIHIEAGFQPASFSQTVFYFYGYIGTFPRYLHHCMLNLAVCKLLWWHTKHNIVIAIKVHYTILQNSTCYRSV